MTERDAAHDVTVKNYKSSSQRLSTAEGPVKLGSSASVAT